MKDEGSRECHRVYAGCWKGLCWLFKISWRPTREKHWSRNLSNSYTFCIPNIQDDLDLIFSHIHTSTHSYIPFNDSARHCMEWHCIALHTYRHKHIHIHIHIRTYMTYRQTGRHTDRQTDITLNYITLDCTKTTLHNIRPYILTYSTTDMHPYIDLCTYK